MWVVHQVASFCKHNWKKALILAALIALIVVAATKVCIAAQRSCCFPRRADKASPVQGLGGVMLWFERQNNWVGWAEFLGVYTAVVALYLPGLPLIMGAGFVFGCAWQHGLAEQAALSHQLLTEPAVQLLEGSLGSLGRGWHRSGPGLHAGQVSPSWLRPLPCRLSRALWPRYLLRDSVTVWLRSKSKRWELIDKALEMEGWKLLFLLRISPLVPYNLLNIAMASTKISAWAFSITSFFGVHLLSRHVM